MKPGLPGLSKITRGQTNEMLWSLRHLLPGKEVRKKHDTQINLKGKVNTSFWFSYSKVMKRMDKTAEVIPLSRFSPGAIQKVWEQYVAPNCRELAKEVHDMDRGGLKLLTTGAANMGDQRIDSSSPAPPTQSPPTSQ